MGSAALGKIPEPETNSPQGSMKNNNEARNEGSKRTGSNDPAKRIGTPTGTATTAMREQVCFNDFQASDIEGQVRPSTINEQADNDDSEGYRLVVTALAAFTNSDETGDAQFQNIIKRTIMKREIIQGEILMRQGDGGDEMYVLESGTLQVIKNKVRGDVIEAGGVVGELALIFDAPRSATVEALEDCVLWALSRVSFQFLLAKQKLRSRVQTAKYLREAGCLMKLDEFNIARLAVAMQRDEIFNNQTLVEEDEMLEKCYLVIEGQVSISSTKLSIDELQKMFPNKTKVDTSGSTPCLVCEAGHFLGIALLSAAVCPHPAQPFDEARKAMRSAVTIQTLGKVQCSYFTIKQFESVLGPVKTVMANGAQKHFGSHRRASVPKINEVLTMSDFSISTFLGAGSFGKVVLGECKKRSHPAFGKNFAIKCMGKHLIEKGGDIDHVKSEKELLGRMNHPLVLGLLCAIQTKDVLYLVTDYVESISLWEVIYKRVDLPADRRAEISKFWAAHVFEALSYVHSEGIAYRDLKPENLLVDKMGHIILIDFGFGKELPQKITSNGEEVWSNLTYTVCGTVEYLAPEMILGGHGHDHTVDYWAFGCLLFEFIAGRTPFVDSAGEDDYRKIIKKICASRFHAIDFSERVEGIFGTGQAAKSEFSYFRDLVSQLLKTETHQRIGNLSGGCDDVKRHNYFSTVDWASVANKKAEAPWIPRIHAPTKPAGSDATHVQPYQGDNSSFADW